MDLLCVIALCIFAVTSSDAALKFYDYGSDDVYAANVSLIKDHLRDFGSYKFSPSDFLNGSHSSHGSFDILNGPLFISYTPPDHAEQHAYYIPNGLAHVEDYDSYGIPAMFEYTPFFAYFSNAIRSKYGNGFTPKAAEIAAPEFFFFNLTALFFGENDVKGVVPFLYLAPQHDRPESFYNDGHFRKFAEFSLYQPFKPNSLLGALFENVPQALSPRPDSAFLLPVLEDKDIPHLASMFPSALSFASGEK